ncbi:MAG: hypothetical protein KA761_09770 [Gemmatimonadaceae bacterium]|nr:hypothetical protein [Gemmatimonadaceae bacterium]
MHLTPHRALHPLSRAMVASWCAIASISLGSANAQQLVTVRGAGATCVSCELRLVDPLDLRVPDTAVALVSPFAFQQDERDRYYFNDPFGTLGVRVFDSAGRYLRTLGRRGQAPGEFLFINAILPSRGDTLHAFGNAHWTFAADGRHLRTQALPDLMTVSRMITLRDRKRLAVGSVNSADAYGQPFHLLGADGSIERSFGLPARASVVSAWSSQRAVAPYGPAGFISAKVNQYELEIWTSDGQLNRTLSRDAEWFQPWTSWNSRSDQRPPPPRLMSIAVDESGLVWTLISVADAAWAPAAATGREGGMPSTGELGRRFDSIIEVLDPVAGKIVWSGRFSQMLIALVKPGVAIENVETEEGEVVVRVWKVTPPARAPDAPSARRPPSARP